MPASSQGRRVARAAISGFASDEDRCAFEKLLAEAQDAFLDGRFKDSEAKCIEALRIKATKEVFSVLEQIADARHDFPRAREFRLLFAYFARDASTWRQLYAEYMEAADFHRAVVCLQRLTTLCDPQEKRQLLIDRAELLISLGEAKRAATVYEELWSQSNYSDFEVFAKLTELYFQLGRLDTLTRLVARSKEALLSDKASASPQAVISLVNVELEVLLERALYGDAVRAAMEAAELLELPLPDMHADIVIRVGIAHVMLGDKAAAMSAFDALSSQQVVKEFGDGLFDACEAMLRVGWFQEAFQLASRMLQHEELRVAGMWYAVARSRAGLGDVSGAREAYHQVFQLEPGHTRTRVALADLAAQLGDFGDGRSHLAAMETDDAFDRVLLNFSRAKLESAAGEHAHAIAAALPVLRCLDVHLDDEESIATGGSRRSNRSAVLPSLVRSSSAIVPALALGGNQYAMHTAASSISASFVTHSVARSSIAVAKQGTIAASSIAASTANGGGNAAAGEIFRFVKSRKRPSQPTTAQPAPSQPRPNNDARDVANLDDLDGLDEAEMDEDGFALPGPRAPVTTEGEESMPDIEAIANEAFDDPEMAALFVAATGGSQPVNEEPDDAIGADEGSQPLNASRTLDKLLLNSKALQMQRNQTVTARDLVHLLGQASIHDLVTSALASYEALEQFDDAKELAQYARIRYARLPGGKHDSQNQRGRRELAQAHVRFSLLVGESRLAVANALICLSELHERRTDDPEVLQLWDLIARVFNIGDRSKVLQRLTQRDDRARSRDALLAVVAGNVFYNGRSFGAAARCYWASLPAHPSDALVNLLVAISFALLVRKKGNTSEKRHSMASHCSLFLERYVALSSVAAAADAAVACEVCFNVARVNFYLSLPHLALPLFHDAVDACDAALRDEGDRDRQAWISSVRQAALHGCATLHRRHGQETADTIAQANAFLSMQAPVDA